MLKFTTTICWSVVWVLYFVVNDFVRGEINEDIDLSTVDLIRKNRYPVEVYSDILTEDNYLLNIHRIPHGRFSKKERSGKPVLLMHGLLGNSRDFVSTGPDKSLAYLLADRGYDVWLGNARGTEYSRKHLTLNPDLDADFWAFSWHEIGLYDLPAMFALITNITRIECLSYIGLSEGTTMFYVLMSLRPEFNHNITISVSLAPVAYMTHLYGPSSRILAAFEPILTPLARLIGLYETTPPQLAPLWQLVNHLFCAERGFFQSICAKVLFLTGGYDPVQLNTTIVPVLFGGYRTAAVREFLHYAQNINSGYFRSFNYGRKINLKRYGTLQPPSYNLSKITSPTALFYAENDWLSHHLDVERLAAELANCVYKYRVPYKPFNHYDYTVANDVVNLVYEKVFYILDKYNKIKT